MAAISSACMPCTSASASSSSSSSELLPLPSSILPKNKHATLSFNTCIYVKVLRKPNGGLFLVRNSNSEFDAFSSSSSSEEETATAIATVTAMNDDEREGEVMEVAKGPPSLISALNVDKALRGIAITDVDHYGRLGLRIGCSYDQVRVAYQNKVNELTTQGSDEEELNKQLQLLKESYTILSSEDERRLYDWSLARSEKSDRYVWPFEVDITQTPKGTPPPPEPEDVGPTRVVGYFILGWVILAFALSIYLNL